jgi:hypothetical protein
VQGTGGVMNPHTAEPSPNGLLDFCTGGAAAVVCVFGSQESMEFVKLIDLMENIWILDHMAT